MLILWGKAAGCIGAVYASASIIISSVYSKVIDSYPAVCKILSYDQTRIRIYTTADPASLLRKVLKCSRAKCQ